MLKLITLTILTFFTAYTYAGNGDKIAVALQTGNTSELASMFNSSIELVMPSTSNVYTKEQAKIVLDNFFKINTPSKATLSHETTGSQSAMLIFDLVTKNGNFRVTIVATTANSSFVINEFKIQ
ncbi:MAG: DUF4783 domain-containing protein [bacterium]|nr:DUF4783 domain-containing protein [bacterium]